MSGETVNFPQWREPGVPEGAPERKDTPALLYARNELHERVSVPVTAPARVRHSAYLLPDEGEETRASVRGAFQELLRKLGVPPEGVQRGERGGSVEKRFPDGSLLRVVWELHTEFYSYTSVLVPPEQPGGDDAFVEPFILPAFPALGSKLVDLDVMVISGLELGGEQRAGLWGGPIYGGLVVNGEAAVWSTFQVDPSGQGRYIVAEGDLGPGRLGRLVRRVLEIETYYHLVLLPLQEYRKQVGTLREAEKRIAARSEDIASDLASREAIPDREHLWLEYLTRDLGDLIRLTERMRYRLSAADSYYAIFEERLHWLREETGGQHQSMSEFLTGRVSPAIRNYRNFIERADVLSGQLTSLGNMMRTRVNLNLEQQSLETMRAMHRRVTLQLMLQKTVEGLSLIVLTYYMTGLANYVLKAVELAVALPGGIDLWTACTIPVWVGLALLITRRVRKLMKRFEEAR